MKAKILLICIMVLACLIFNSCAKKQIATVIAEFEPESELLDDEESDDSTVSLQELISQNQFRFYIQRKDGGYAGTIENDHGEWECSYGASYYHQQYDTHEIINNTVIVSYLSCNFILRGEPAYRDYNYPKKESAIITKKQIERRLSSDGNNGEDGYDGGIDLSKIVVSKGNCHALVITDGLRVRENPDTKVDTKVIGKFNKFDDIYLIDCTESKDKIDNLEFPWYKVQLADGTEGWVFGGFAKIYFNEHDKERIKAAFAEHESEYWNQYVTPDYS
ncbi:MAG: SH3 domain-containing protein [Treponema sp.]|nr:SH3 domain-containing protein [Treponema sp.]